jgi:hypothetical protein
MATGSTSIAWPAGLRNLFRAGGRGAPMLLDEAYGPETLPDGSLIVVKLTDQ